MRFSPILLSARRMPGRLANVDARRTARAAAPLLRPVFAWNHGKVMCWGETGLANRRAA